jgi:hypothetical protein
MVSLSNHQEGQAVCTNAKVFVMITKNSQPSFLREPQAVVKTRGVRASPEPSVYAGSSSTARLDQGGDRQKN